jgi:hypothetical protein
VIEIRDPAFGNGILVAITDNGGHTRTRRRSCSILFTTKDRRGPAWLSIVSGS